MLIVFRRDLTKYVNLFGLIYIGPDVGTFVSFLRSTSGGKLPFPASLYVIFNVSILEQYFLVVEVFPVKRTLVHRNDVLKVILYI